MMRTEGFETCSMPFLLAYLHERLSKIVKAVVHVLTRQSFRKNMSMTMAIRQISAEDEFLERT